MVPRAAGPFQRIRMPSGPWAAATDLRPLASGQVLFNPGLVCYPIDDDCGTHDGANEYGDEGDEATQAHDASPCGGRRLHLGVCCRPRFRAPRNQFGSYGVRKCVEAESSDSGGESGNEVSDVRASVAMEEQRYRGLELRMSSTRQKQEPTRFQEITQLEEEKTVSFENLGAATNGRKGASKNLAGTPGTASRKLCIDPLQKLLMHELWRNWPASSL
jgi:hypothetical protein